MSEVNLETQVQDLTARLTQAEEQIKQLMQLTSTFRNELLEQRKVIKALSSGQNASEQNNCASGAPPPTESLSGKGPDGIAGILQVQSLDESWEFNDSMEIDWDALDVLNINTLPEATTTDAVATATFTTALITTPAAGAPQVPPLSTHKHPREEDNLYEGTDIKAMRYDSLDRILAYTVKASSVSDKNLVKVDASVNYDEERKAISGKIFRYINVGDMNALSKLVSEYFCDSCVMYYCQISDHIHGKAEAMMLFSLLYENYPDGVWKVVNTEVQGKVVTYTYLFTGTSVFDVPVAVSYHQVKEHERTHGRSENSEEASGHQIVRNVAEYSASQSHSSSHHNLHHNMQQNMQHNVHHTVQHHAQHGMHNTFSFRQSSTSNAPEFDISAFSVYDKIHTPRSSDGDTTPGPSNGLSATSGDAVPASHASVSATSGLDGDVIKIPRSKGNESFRLDGRAGSFTLGSSERKGDHSRPHSINAGHRPSANTELMANALIKKSEHERRKCEITFNDYNLIVQIVISPCAK